jgi:hypothetical protein
MELLEIKKTTLELISNLEVRAYSIKDLFFSNEIKEGSDRLLNFTEDILVLIKGIIAIDSEQKIIQVSDINQKLKDILQALAMDDPFYISDLLEQEIIPLLIFWKEKLSQDGKI